MVDTSEFLSALEKVLSNNIEKNEIVDLMRNVVPGPSYRLISEALHQAYHFLSDGDLRKNDPDYDRFFRGEIGNYISSIGDLNLS